MTPRRWISTRGAPTRALWSGSGLADDFSCFCTIRIVIAGLAFFFSFFFSLLVRVRNSKTLISPR